MKKVAAKSVLMYTTASGKKALQLIAHTLLQKRLIACANILGPVESRYVWKKKIEVSKEFILMIKTTSPHGKKVEALVEKLHPYDCPVIETFEVNRMNALGLRWLHESLR